MPQVPDSVRLALPAEAEVIAAIQRRTWVPGHPGHELLDQVDLAEMTAVWQSAILRPPLAQNRVLVAVSDRGVVGFAALAPAADPDSEPTDGEVLEFAIDPAARRVGHGSRLLNAIVDTLRADGFERATWWLLSTDDAVRQLLTSAGWAADGAHRELGSEDGSLRFKQVRLHSDIRAAS